MKVSVGFIGFFAVLLFVGACATTPQELEERLGTIDSVSEAAGRTYAAVLWIQYGDLNLIDLAIENANRDRKRDVLYAPSEETKAYLNASCVARMRGMETFVLEIEKGEVP